MTLPLAEVFERAADLIEPEGAWCQNYFAKDAFGTDVSSTDERGVCWCVEGAIIHVAGRDNAECALGTLSVFLQTGAILVWNDATERTQAEVVATLRALAERTDHDA